MTSAFESRPGRSSVTTPDELVVQLREAGAKRVYLSRAGAFRDGSVPITATYEIAANERASEREMLVSVFEAIDDHLWFGDREWVLEWDVEPAYADPPLELLPLYDRGVEHKHGDGFNLRILLFVYEEHLESNDES